MASINVCGLEASTVGLVSGFRPFLNVDSPYWSFSLHIRSFSACVAFSGSALICMLLSSFIRLRILSLNVVMLWLRWHVFASVLWMSATERLFGNLF